MSYGGNLFIIWHYQTSDTAEEVAHQNYFLEGAYMLRKNDFLVVTADIKRDPVHGLFIVRQADKTLVEITDFGAMPTTKLGGLTFWTTRR